MGGKFQREWVASFSENGWQVSARMGGKFQREYAFSLYELNQAIYGLLEELNAQGFQRREGTRKSVFEAVDKPAMRPLPTTSYEYAECQAVQSPDELPRTGPRRLLLGSLRSGWPDP